MEYRKMQGNDYSRVRALWNGTPGVLLGDSDSEANVCRFLDRNSDMSFVAEDGEKICGTILGGTDGRRGYLHHLTVHPDYRRRGIASELVERSLKALTEAGIPRSYIYLLRDNSDGKNFWDAAGWKECEFLVLSRWHAD